MAKATGLSDSTIGRIWHENGLKPHQVRTFKLSKDPCFTEKLNDIVGLYLNPPAATGGERTWNDILRMNREASEGSDERTTSIDN